MDPTAKPEDTTAKPIDAAVKPEDATAKPEDATATPEDATTKPIDATAEPVDATATPDDATTKPIDATTEPVDATAKPEDATAKPEDAKPAEDTTKPVDIDATTKPVVAATKPEDARTETTDLANGDATKPSREGDSTKPSGEGDATKSSKEGDATKTDSKETSEKTKEEKTEEKKTEEEKTEEEKLNETREAAKEKCDPKYLDLAFAMDCTSSMGSYIAQAQRNIRNIVEEIVAKEHADVRLALVEYRDHPPQDPSFVTRVHEFTSSVKDMKDSLNACKAQGGGDHPEAVADALHQVLKLNWREDAVKICVFISDAPPHGLTGSSSDGFPDGCPDGLDPMVTTKEIAEKGISLYVVGCEPSIAPYKEFFSALAHLTGGQYVPLTRAKLLTQVIVGGVEEELSLKKLLEEVDEEVRQESKSCAVIDTEALSRRLHTKMASRGEMSSKLTSNTGDLPATSAYATDLSECSDMCAVRKKYVTPAGSMSWMEGRSGPSGAARTRPMKKARSDSGVAAARRSSPAANVEEDGWLGLFGLFGSKSHRTTAEDGKCNALEEMRAEDEDEDRYMSSSGTVGGSQVARMVQKSIMQNKLSGRVSSKRSDEATSKSSPAEGEGKEKNGTS